MKNIYKEIQKYFENKRVYIDYPLGSRSCMKAGGKADCLFYPESIEILQEFFSFLYKHADECEVSILGGLSNVVIRDGGVRGVAVRLFSPYIATKSSGCIAEQVLNLYNNFEEGKRIEVVFDAGTLNSDACKFLIEYGVSGLEFLVGIPGTIGGGVCMNAGACGSEIGEVLAWVEVLDYAGNIRRIKRKELNMCYRDGGILKGEIVIRAAFSLFYRKSEEVSKKCETFLKERNKKIKLEKGWGTSGSAFKNPDPRISDGKSAWKLIDEAGCRGMKLGGAMISDQHANFLINTGNATSTEIEDLGECVRALVLEKTGVSLDWELKFLGKRI